MSSLLQPDPLTSSRIESSERELEIRQQGIEANGRFGGVIAECLSSDEQVALGLRIGNVIAAVTYGNPHRKG